MASLNGIPLKEGLEVEIYSKSQESWRLGHIESIRPSTTYEILYTVVYQDGWYKQVELKEVHLFLRLPPKKQSDGPDEEQKLQDGSKYITEKLQLPLKKETVYESLRMLLKEARNIDIHGMRSIKIIM